MGGRIDITFMCVKFGDDPISSLDFNFIGGCTFNFLIHGYMTVMEEYCSMALVDVLMLKYLYIFIVTILYYNSWFDLMLKYL